MKLHIFTGNEAVAKAAIDSGIRVATSYPGSPTVQILEAVATYEGVHAEWSPSEKVAVTSKGVAPARSQVTTSGKPA